MRLSLADIHCDTAYEAFVTSQSVIYNSLSVSVNLAQCFERYIQVLAIWSDKRLNNDDAYLRFFDILNYIKKDISTNDSIAFNTFDKDISFILSLEDARILNNDISRLNTIHKQGVKIITFLWHGNSCIGGAYNTHCGLTSFGKKAVNKAAELGIIADVSHASIRSASDIFEIYEKRAPVIASHSNSYKITPHERNLRDEQFEYIKRQGGIVGISLCKEHLGEIYNKSSEYTVLKHIDHYLSLGGEDTVCFGCDFDGAETPPALSNIASMQLIAEKMARANYTNTLIDKIFYLNAKNFILKNIK